MQFSIITPCYKSGRTLMRAYKSLLESSIKDFEWILVDDCSPDGGETVELIKEIQDQAPFTVKSVFLTENYFCSKSVYEGSLIAEGDFVCILDQDDELTPNALSGVSNIIKNFSILENPRIAGVCGRCVDEKGKLIGKNFPEEAFKANEGDIRFKLKEYCELLQFTKTQLIRDHFVHMKPGFTNGFLWARISESHDYIFSNLVVRVYDTYNPESYSNNKSMILSYPKNKALNLKGIVNSYAKYAIYNIPYTLRKLSSMNRYNYIGQHRMKVSDFKGLLLKCLFVISVPIGFCKGVWDKKELPRVHLLFK